MDLQSSLQKTLGESYTIERELDGGGMARVFVAHDQQLDRKVVVKTLADDSGVSVSADRFRREIRLAASLQQANIVPVHSAGDVGGVPYYTMPFVEGQSLRAHMDARGALDVREAVNILRDVARALAFAHERGVVHRDIKPENILLSGSTAVVTDFGIAKAIEASHSMSGATMLTQLGTLLGTPAYISPEQAAGDPQVDHLADIYSLGIVAYEMLAGTRPFTATTARALLAAHVTEQPPELTSKRDGLPPRLAALVMRCLEKEPARRPQKAGDLLNALETALTSSVATTGGTTPSIAVLPFANLSPDADDGFFADGLTDEIITDLSGLKSLRVIARAAVMRYKGTDKEPTAVARELRVRYVLDGSVRRAGASMRLTARLLDIESDSTIWADKLSGTVEDVFAMQERVSRTIVDALKLKLTAREERHLADRPFEDLRAYEAYLQAKQAMWSFGPAPLQRARELVQLAISRVGESPLLVSALGFIAIHAISAGGADMAAEATTAEACARKLVLLAPDSFGRYALEGLLHWRRGEIGEAIATLSSAHEREPSNVDVVVYLQYCYLMAGRDDRARETSRLVVALDPVTPLMQVMPTFCDLMAGRTREVLDAYAEFASREPLNPLAQFWLLSIRAEGADVPGMRESAADLVSRWPASEFGEAARITLELLDNPGAASALVVPPAIRVLSAESESIARSLTWLFARLGAHEAALDALQDAIDRGLAHYPHLARDCHSLAETRRHPRFQRLLAIVRERWERGGTSASDLAQAMTPESPAVPKPVIAVLPLANIGAGADDEYFADGMTEDIISQLSQIASLRVISRTSAMGYKNSSRKPREIAAELNASHVIEGSMRRAGDRVRIVARLMEARTEAHLWSETFNRDLTDIFAIQSELAQRIATALVARLSPAEARRVAKRPTMDMEAYNLFLLGRQEYNRVSPQAFARAEEFYDQAIARDPSFARAYAAKALVHMYHGGGYWGVKPTVAYERAVALARKAIELDPDVGEAHMVLGAYESWIRFDWGASEAHFTRAIALNPSHAFTHIMHGWLQLATGRLDEAVQSARFAVELDPVAPLILANALSFHHIARQRGDFDIELMAARRLTAMDGVDTIVRTFESISRGQANEILPEIRALARGAENVFLRALHAWCAAAAGADAEARAVIGDLHAQERKEYVWATGFALAYAHLGESAKAFEYLERAYQDRAGWLNVLGCSPAFDPFRGDPRFDRIVKRVGVVVVPEVSNRRFTPMPAPRTSKAAQDGKSVAVLPLTNLSGSSDDEYFADRRSVAVLPFANLSPDPENEFFAEGITDDLIAQIARIRSLRVIARTSVLRYRGVPDAARTAARELGVGAVVEGTVRRAGKRARIVAQLIDSASAAPIWSETYDRDLDDIFSVQTEVATCVAGALKANLKSDERLRLEKPRVDAATYDLYLLGRHHANRRTDDSLRKAISYFGEAIARDPKFSAAHAGLADAYLFAGLGYATIPAPEAFAFARKAVAGALALDDALPEALCAEGMVAMHCDWDVPRARRAFERAIDLNPNAVAGYQWLAWTQFAVGDYLDAAKTQERALELDPLNVSVITESGWPYSYAGLHEIALTRYQRAIELDPGYALGYYNAGMSMHMMGNHAAGISAYQHALASVGRMAFVTSQLAIAKAQTGSRADAEELLDELRAQAGAGGPANISLAMVADELGLVSEALDALERAYATREPFIWCLGLEMWLRLPNVRHTPRFEALCARMEIKPHDVAGQRAVLLAHAQERGFAPPSDPPPSTLA
jgi:eukaryotic-like serine/threonine-protein kinase